MSRLKSRIKNGKNTKDNLTKIIPHQKKWQGLLILFNFEEPFSLFLFILNHFLRKKAFLEKDAQIEKHNQNALNGKKSFVLKHNQYSDSVIF